ncbi:putative oxidoreductase [Pseudomonas sp. BAY1663]|nr:putative oxidoreductase [Pseudomonas sp. BAY1663]
MKAVLCKAFGPAENLVLEEIASPSIKPNEILLEVHAAGVNFPDTLMIEAGTSSNRRSHSRPAAKPPGWSPRSVKRSATSRLAIGSWR